MTKITTLITAETQKKLNDCAEKAGLPANQLLNILINDEIERQRLLGIYQEISVKKDKNKAIPSQKIAALCNKYLSVLDHESENITIREAIENLYNDLLSQKLISVNTRKNNIIEGERLKTSRISYYWYAGTLAKHIGICFGTLNVYLFHELLYPMSEIIFIGMPNNVEVCSHIFSHLYNLFKKTQIAYKKSAGKWGNKKEMEDAANHYMSRFVEDLGHTQAYIENDNYNEHLYDYATEKFSWALRD